MTTDPKWIVRGAVGIAPAALAEMGEMTAERRARISERRAHPRAFWPADSFGPFGLGKQSEPEKPYAVINGVAVIRVEGALSFSAGWWWSEVDTGRLAATIRAAGQDLAARSILIDWHSPGGAVAGLADLVAAMKFAGSRKRLVSYAHDMLGSAAAWAGLQGAEVYVTRTAMLGSLGIYVVVDDESAAYAKMGVTRHVVAVGQYKGLSVPGLPVSEALIAQQMGECQAMYGLMTADVAAGRKRDEAWALSVCDGRVHIGAEAVKVGLADGVTTPDELIAAMAAGRKPGERAAVVNVGPSGSAAARPSVTTPNRAAPRKLAMTLDELKQQYPDLVKQIEDAAVESYKTTQQSAAPKPEPAATLAQLEAEFTDDAPFVLAQLKAGASLSAARGAYIQTLRGEVGKLKGELKTYGEAASKADAIRAKTGTTPGVAPVANANATEKQPESFAAKVHAYAVQNKVHPKVAVHRVAQAEPESYRKYLADLRAGKVSAIG